ncbi:MAG: acyl-CoA reductase [Endomicrobium sp.]|nr:acyl-CoA reductase [Endomicrobium sp.]
MQRLEGAAIFTGQNFKDLAYIIGTEKIVEQMPYIPTLILFSEEVLSFFNALSGELLKSGKAFSDVITFAFWCRKATMLQEKAKYNSNETRLGRGIVFHNTPSNVPVNFAYSFAAGLLGREC